MEIVYVSICDAKACTVLSLSLQPPLKQYLYIKAQFTKKHTMSTHSQNKLRIHFQWHNVIRIPQFYGIINSIIQY